MSSQLPPEFVRPSTFGDVLVTLGSANPLHVMPLTDAIRGRGIRAARCGKRARVVRMTNQNIDSANLSRRVYVCPGCREFCRGVNVQMAMTPAQFDALRDHELTLVSTTRFGDLKVCDSGGLVWLLTPEGVVAPYGDSRPPKADPLTGDA